MSDAIRLIVTERMLSDRERGEIKPFSYVPAPTPRDRRRRDRVIEPGPVEPATFPLGEPPATAGPLPAPSGGLSLPSKEEIIPEDPVRSESSEEPATSPSKTYFGHMNKPRYPGTMEEYLKDRRRSEFLPPEE